MKKVEDHYAGAPGWPLWEMGCWRRCPPWTRSSRASISLSPLLFNRDPNATSLSQVAKLDFLHGAGVCSWASSSRQTQELKPVLGPSRVHGAKSHGWSWHLLGCVGKGAWENTHPTRPESPTVKQQFLPPMPPFEAPEAPFVPNQNRRRASLS